MMDTVITKKNIVGGAFVMVIIVIFGTFFFSLDPVSAVKNDSAAPSVVFQINQGEGSRAIAQALFSDHLIRSSLSFELFSLLDGRAFELKPGLYRLDPSMGTPQIIAAISDGDAGETTVTIPEGSNIYDIDRILSNALVIQPGALIAFAKTATATGASTTSTLEGHLFPDTYQFHTNADVSRCGSRNDK